MRNLRIVLVAMLSLFWMGCEEERFVVPPLVKDGEPAVQESGAIATYDLLTENLEESMLFYGALFAWTFEPLSVGPGYIARWNNRNVAVFFDNAYPYETEGGNRSLWLPSIVTHYLPASEIKILEEGATSLRAAFPLPDRGQMGIYRDVEGAPFALLVPAGGISPRQDRFWKKSELLALRPELLVEFYEKALGYVAVSTRSMPPTILLRSEGDTRSTLSQTPFVNVTAVWVPVAEVRSVREIMMLAEHFGGKVLVPVESPKGPVQRAVLQDPMGAIFAVQKESK